MFQHRATDAELSGGGTTGAHHSVIGWSPGDGVTDWLEHKSRPVATIST